MSKKQIDKLPGEDSLVEGLERVHQAERERLHRALARELGRPLSEWEVEFLEVAEEFSAVFKGVAKSAIESLPPVELKRLPQPHKCVVYRDGGECRYPIEDCSECPKHEGMRAVLAERQKGEWKCMADCGVTECDQCGWNVEEYVGDYNFCPSCGADMRGADDE